MKTRFLTVIAALVLSATAIQAQVDFGIVAGPNFANMVGKDGDGDKITNGLLVGFHAGVKVNLYMAPDFYFQTGLLFSQKGSLNNGGALPSKAASDDYHTTSRLSYIEMPLHLLFKPQFGKGNILVGFGPYVAYGITGKQTIEAGDFSYDQKVKFKNEIGLEDYWDMDNAYFRGFDAGADIFAGYEMNMGLYFQLNAQLGLLDIVTDVTEWESESVLRNTGFGVSVGYNF
jgi:Outer membrane protein beta-barrel domain